MFIIVLFVTLIVSFRSFLLANLIEPFALLLWALWQVVSSVDQHIYWIVLIAICSILVIRIFPSTNESSREAAYNHRDRPLSRVDYWQSLIKNATLGNDGNQRLHDNLKNLLTTVVTQDGQPEPTQLEEGIAKGKTPLPPTVKSFLFPPNRTRKKFPIGWQLNLPFLGPRWLRRWANKFIHQDYTMIDETLRWMEIELEINDEN